MMLLYDAFLLSHLEPNYLEMKEVKYPSESICSISFPSEPISSILTKWIHVQGESERSTPNFLKIIKKNPDVLWLKYVYGLKAYYVLCVL